MWGSLLVFCKQAFLLGNLRLLTDLTVSSPMRVMDELSEAAQRRTPSFHYAGGQSPRVGSSCASAVYHLIDWNLSKRFSSTKRIVAGTRLVNEFCIHPFLVQEIWHGNHVVSRCSFPSPRRSPLACERVLSKSLGHSPCD